MEMIERVAAAIDEYIGDAETSHQIARAVIEAMKYDDGPEDESRLVAASNEYRVEAVALAEAWDHMIDAALAEGGRWS